MISQKALLISCESCLHKKDELEKNSFELIHRCNITEKIVGRNEYCSNHELNPFFQLTTNDNPDIIY